MGRTQLFALPLLPWDVHLTPRHLHGSLLQVALPCPDEALVTADCTCVVLLLSCNCTPTSKCTNNDADHIFMNLITFYLEHGL